MSDDAPDTDTPAALPLAVAVLFPKLPATETYVHADSFTALYAAPAVAMRFPFIVTSVQFSRAMQSRVEPVI